MAEISTPVNNSYQNTVPANLINDLVPEEDQQFNAFIRLELKKIVRNPDPVITQRLLTFSKSLKKI